MVHRSTEIHRECSIEFNLIVRVVIAITRLRECVCKDDAHLGYFDDQRANQAVWWVHFPVNSSFRWVQSRGNSSVRWGQFLVNSSDRGVHSWWVHPCDVFTAIEQKSKHWIKFSFWWPDFLYSSFLVGISTLLTFTFPVLQTTKQNSGCGIKFLIKNCPTKNSRWRKRQKMEF